MSIETIIILSVFLLILVMALLPIFIQRTIVATIAGFSWARTVFLEHYIWVEESSYSGFPDESRNQTSTIETYYVSEIVRYDTVTTQMDGVTSTTTQPVYGQVRRERTKYTYEIQRWVESRVLHSEGTKHNTVYWPDYTLDRKTRERIAKTKESYMVFFETAKGKKYQRKLPQSEWNALDDTATYDLRVNLYGKITKSPTLHNTQEAPAEYEPMQQEMP